MAFQLILTNECAVAEPPVTDKMRYRIRYFYSKGAFLVLLWTTLGSVAAWSFVCLYSILIKDIRNVGWYRNIAFLPVIPFLLFTPLAGWLADSKFGNFRVFKFGAVLLFLSVLMTSICTMLLRNFSSIRSFVLSGAVVLIPYSLGFVGFTACIVTSLQLGLDQMPDASSSNITSFIKWFAFSICLGIWISDSVWSMFGNYCLNGPVACDHGQVFSLLPVLSMSIVCCTIFLLAPKWLTIEPKSPQSLRTIYQVLKFAAKHKSPLNRSALTYWEEDIPSRLDLGKSRYGGPFTTEQVEDVKTFFKVVLVHLPWFIITLIIQPSNTHLSYQEQIEGIGVCTSNLLYLFTYSPFLCAMIVTLFIEFIAYPLVKRSPSTLKCIGIVCFIILLVTIGYLIVLVVDHFHHLKLTPWREIVYSVFFGSFDVLMLTFTTQFVCAQSPYSMRGLLSGYSIFLHLASIGLGTALFRLIRMLCRSAKIIRWSVAAGLGLVGFTLHCVLAHKYKRRVRDEEYDPHRVIEEVYDRYLSQDCAQIT